MTESRRPSTDWDELDGSTPLTEREVRKLRGIILEHEREAWARRRLRVLAPWVVGLIVGAWGFYEWIAKHITFKGP